MTPGPLVLALLAQGLAAAPSNAARADPSALEYRVGPGDVLDVRVAGHPEHARLPTVQTTGVIFVTPLGTVKVAGLTTGEIGVKLTELWSARDPGRPTVRVTVKDYQSQFVWVAGEVSRPGRKSLRGRTRLVDALVEAGGFTVRASREVVVERKEGTFDDGTTVRRLRFTGTTPTPQEILDLETLLHPRDVITAQDSRLVTVSGAVARPGRYALKRGTLTEALTAAGGVTKFAGKRVTVKGVDPETRTARVMEVDLEEVEQGRHPDPVLFFGDEVVVKARVL
jgi:polysaccharide biosynthesis/export protein